MDRPRAAPRNFYQAKPPGTPSSEEPPQQVTSPVSVDNNNDIDEPDGNRRGLRSGRRRRLDSEETIEKLKRDLARRDHELEDERLEVERALDKIKKLERDKAELKREVEDAREEAGDYRKNFEDLQAQVRGEETGSPGSDDNHNHLPHSVKNLELALQGKNREISQLLEDIEKSDDDKQALEGKLNELKDSLADATTHIETMANEHFGMKNRLDKAQARIKIIQEENTVLKLKQKDLEAFKERYEQYLQNLQDAVDFRVEAWKQMMQSKDEEIDRLNVKVATLTAQLPAGQLDTGKTVFQQMKQKLSDRDHQINLLNENLRLATDEINSSVEIIESLQSKLNLTEDSEKTAKQLRSLHSKLKKMESLVEKKTRVISLTEQEAEDKSRELTEVLSRLHAFESGEYGLSEAMMEIKELKTAVKVRDNQIEVVTQEINIAHMQLSDLTEQNEMLRDKCGLHDPVDINLETKRYAKNKRNEVIALRAKVTQLEDDIVQLKTQNHSLRKGLQGQVHEGQGEQETQIQSLMSDVQRKYDCAQEECQGLRQALRDIITLLQDLTEQDSDPETLLELPNALQQVLKELVPSETIQWSVSFTTFHVKFVTLNGRCAQLKEEIERLRQNERATLDELVDAKATIQRLQDKPTDPGIRSPRMKKTSVSTSPAQSPKKVVFDSQVHFSDGEESPAPFLASVEQHSEAATITVSSQSCQTDGTQSEELVQNREKLEKVIGALRGQVNELEFALRTRDQIINELRQVQMAITEGISKNPDSLEALEVARDSISSLQERLKAKEDNIAQYRKLLADVRAELTSTTERHLAEMKALQVTIFQQQQAFTRMKTTLSQPVRDSLNIEGTIKDQLSRIHELEDQVSELQHALGNVASELTSARAEATKWRSTADAKTKETDAIKDQTLTEFTQERNVLQLKCTELQNTIDELQSQLDSARSRPSTLVDALRADVEDKQKQLEAYAKTVMNLKGSKTILEKGQLETRLADKEKETADLSKQNETLKRKVSDLQVKISKSKAINFKTGLSAELDELREIVRMIKDDKMKLEKQLGEINSKRDEEEEKRRKTMESVIRWEESKKWKKAVEKLETRIKEMEQDSEKCDKLIRTLRSNLSRMEKEKIILDSRIRARARSASTSAKTTSSLDNIFSSSDGGLHGGPLSLDSHVTKLTIEISDLKELVEKKEFEGNETAERLRMEIRCLKERIVSQERHIVAYQIAQKGDPSIVSQIEKMASHEESLQKQMLVLEEENLALKVQIEQLRVDTPRLRDRVQHLQKMVDALRTEKANLSEKNLTELERTIGALKDVIAKLQMENKKLKSTTTPSHPAVKSVASTEKLKTTLDSMMMEKRSLTEQVEILEHERSRFQKLYLEASSNIETIESRLTDAEKRAKSSEMKLKTFLTEHRSVFVSPEAVTLTTGNPNDTMYSKFRQLQEELERKTRLLNEAHTALRQAELSYKSRPPGPPPN